MFPRYGVPVVVMVESSCSCSAYDRSPKAVGVMGVGWSVISVLSVSGKASRPRPLVFKR